MTTAELSPNEMCGEDGRPQESGLVFTEKSLEDKTSPDSRVGSSPKMSQLLEYLGTLGKIYLHDAPSIYIYLHIHIYTEVCNPVPMLRTQYQRQKRLWKKD